ncbi:acetate--CoA ligase family protein [Rhodococcus opacus]|uniref:Acetate--CoA ligase family protein n=2 Tax=Rhodococcus opacus TaxID=37919 RepID=A0AAX3YCC1_RHOOP|nr:acetate--CoA ligase family protein [Rhodococcus opacus]MBA8964998.1 acyl-CoA synthetase (NDP forming) [Rhodococcus opacus]MBP2208550.1 acyl-CoA synthetase (NDP forming) [Rhodococcus opacus]MCZ4583073.1 acetate--CoA ligase family protein [Rhodococcus opacus]WKN54281.1 acetate--CoA ligase family protein [Rhodococcus opacus]WLF45724.1 acetate--CoA ligase family protein [Rhodococcus opacus]
MTPANNVPALANFEKAFRPRSVAVIGASDDATRISGRALHYLIRAGYRGEIYPVNHRRATVQGLRAYPTLADVPRTPDIALIALPSRLLEDALTDCVEHGVGAAVVYAAGFAETGSDGGALQDRLAAIAAAGNIRLFGPNCLGLLHTDSGFTGTFSSAFDKALPTPGGAAIVSQSGAYGGHLAYLCEKRGIGVGYWVSTGNEAGTDVADCIHWLALQDDVSVILAYAEGIRDGDSFRAALRAAHDHRKPVVFMKVGQSAAGATAAQSHTASLAGADAVFDGLCAQYGVYRAQTTQEQVDVAYAAVRGRFPSGRSLGIITVSGGFGVQLCDAAERGVLEVTPLAESGRAKLRALNPMGSDDNPCDTTAGWLNDMSLITKTFDVMYSDGGYDSIIGSFTMLPDSLTYGAEIRTAIGAGTREFLDRPTALCMEARPEVVRAYESDGFLVFDDSERAVTALAALAYFVEHFDTPIASHRKRTTRVDLGGEPLSEHAAQQILADAGIPFPASTVVTHPDDVAKAAADLGFPLVMKIVSPDIAHKTEIGGVILDVEDEAQASAAYLTLLERANAAVPGARIEGVLLGVMCPKGVETIVGVTNDPAFGPTVMFGLGGMQAELFRDVAFRVGELDHAEAVNLIREIKGYPLLTGFRGAAPADVDALADLLVAVSRFAVTHADQLDSLDLNPVLVLEEGRGALALDALITVRTTS